MAALGFDPRISTTPHPQAGYVLLTSFVSRYVIRSFAATSILVVSILYFPYVPHQVAGSIRSSVREKVASCKRFTNFLTVLWILLLHVSQHHRVAGYARRSATILMCRPCYSMHETSASYGHSSKLLWKQIE